MSIPTLNVSEDMIAKLLKEGRSPAEIAQEWQEPMGNVMGVWKLLRDRGEIPAANHPGVTSSAPPTASAAAGCRRTGPSDSHAVTGGQAADRVGDGPACPSRRHRRPSRPVRVDQSQKGDDRPRGTGQPVRERSVGTGGDRGSRSATRCGASTTHRREAAQAPAAEGVDRGV